MKHIIISKQYGICLELFCLGMLSTNLFCGESTIKNQPISGNDKTDKIIIRGVVYDNTKPIPNDLLDRFERNLIGDSDKATNRISFEAAQPKPLCSAVVIARSKSVSRKAISNDKGEYVFDDMPYDDYEVSDFENLFGKIK